MKYLIAALGNIGTEYNDTRHNIGFDIADVIAETASAKFSLEKLAMTTELRWKGRHVTIIKPTTYMNLSGKAVLYWLSILKLTPEQLLVVTDDLSLEPGVIRLRGKGSDGGHNGLKSIQECLQTQDYPRLRFGIGNRFPKGRQAEFVLGKWNTDEKGLIEEKIIRAADAIKCFVTEGLSNAMNQYNG